MFGEAATRAFVMHLVFGTGIQKLEKETQVLV